MSAPTTPASLDAALERAAGVVDALLGTGFSGAPREPISGAIAAINAARRAAPGHRVIACDMPSGVDGSTGEISGEAVEADATVTFHAAKPGLWIAPGKQHSGEVHVVDIGIPAAEQPVTPAVGLIADSRAKPRSRGAKPARRSSAPAASWSSAARAGSPAPPCSPRWPPHGRAQAT